MLSENTAKFHMPSSWCAGALGISPQALHKRIKGWGLEPVGKQGRFKLYDFKEIIRLRLEESELPTTDHKTESLALLAAKRQLAELDLAERAGELVPVEDVKSTWAEMIVAAKARFMAIPARASFLAGMDEREIFKELKTLTWDALHQLSQDGGSGRAALPVGSEDRAGGAEESEKAGPAGDNS